MLIVFTWYLAMQLFALAAWPLAFSACNRLHDRGYALSKGLGLLLITYITWLLAHAAGRIPALGFSFGTVSAAWFAVLIISLVCLARNFRDVMLFIRRNKRYIIITEVLFAAAFAAMVAVKAQVPHISYHVANPLPGQMIDHAAEKFTDFAVLNSLLTSHAFPPHDAWVSGHTLNYYYFGHMLWAVLIKFCSVRPEIGFNLGMAGAFALAITLAFGVGYNLTRRVRWGLLLMFLVVLASNLDGFLQMISSLKMTFIDGRGKDLWYLDRPWWQNYEFWRSSRAIKDTINEFPAFSFILGDLHAHLSALLINLCGWNLAVQVFRSVRQYRSIWRYEVLAFDELFLAALVCGALSASNTWDVPLFTGVLALALWAGNTGRRDPYAWHSTLNVTAGRVVHALEALFIAGITAALGVLLFFLPFIRNFSAPQPPPELDTITEDGVQKLVQVPGRLIKAVDAMHRSSFFEFLGHWLLLAAVPVAFFVVTAFRRRREAVEYVTTDPATQQNRARSAALVLIAVAAGAVLMALWQGWVAIIMFMAAVIIGIALVARHLPPLTRWVWGLLLVFCVMTWFTEMFYVDDIFEGAINRLNTVFKIYYGLWTLMAVATVLSLRMLVRMAPRGRRCRRAVWLVGPIVIAGLPYMFLGTLNRIESSTRLGHWEGAEDSPQTAPPSRLFSEAARPKNLEEALDGMRYLAFLHPDDYAAMNWIRQNLPPAATLLEAAGSQYTYSGRMGTMTGRPSFAGWLSHAWGWRGYPFGYPGDPSNPKAPKGERLRRTDKAAEIYNEVDPERALKMLQEEGIQFVVLGDHERQQYPAINEIKFPLIGKAIFREGNTTIYRVNAKVERTGLPPTAPPPDVGTTLPTQLDQSYHERASVEPESE